MQGPDAAPELDPGPSAKPFGRAHADVADRAGSRDVRSAAGRQVELLYLDDPQQAGPRRFFAQRQTRRLRLIDEADGDRPVFPDDLIGRELRGARSAPARLRRARSIVADADPR